MVCAVVQGLWLTQCGRGNVTLAHATWSKVHSMSLDGGWRPFAPPGNLTLALDMNLGDKKLRRAAGASNRRPQRRWVTLGLSRQGFWLPPVRWRRQLASDEGGMAPWKRAAAAMAVATRRRSAFPPLLYEYDPRRTAGAPLMRPLNPRVATLHYETCRWGGCHPPRNEPYVEWPAWGASEAQPATTSAALGTDIARRRV